MASVKPPLDKHSQNLTLHCIELQHHKRRMRLMLMAAQHQSGEGGVCKDVTVKVQKMEILEYMHSRLCYPEPWGWVFCKFLGRGCADGTLRPSTHTRPCSATFYAALCSRLDTKKSYPIPDLPLSVHPYCRLNSSFN